MEFTGERYVPNLDSPEISYEHWHRYIYATQFVRDKVILDVACGEGYGSCLLAQSARQVIGVDISRETIDHAANKYVLPNLRFEVGSLASTGVKDSDVDGVVCFESIEHIGEEDQEAFLREVKRVLRPDGFLLISTPNKLLYSDAPNYRNEFHVREFHVNEFRSFLEKAFVHVMLLGQRIYPVSYVWTLDGAPSPVVEHRLEYTAEGFRPSHKPREALFVIAICSDAPIGDAPSSVMIDLSHRLLGPLEARDAQVRGLAEQLEARDAQARGLAEQLEARDAQVQGLAGQLEARDAQVQGLAGQLEARDAQVQGLAGQLEAQDAQVQALAAQVTELERTVSSYALSKSWRLTRPLRTLGRLFRRVFR